MNPIIVPKTLEKDFEEAFEYMQVRALDQINRGISQVQMSAEKDAQAQLGELTVGLKKISGLTLEEWVLEHIQPVVADILKQKRKQQLGDAFHAESGSKEKAGDTEG